MQETTKAQPQGIMGTLGKTMQQAAGALSAAVATLGEADHETATGTEAEATDDAIHIAKDMADTLEALGRAMARGEGAAALNAVRTTLRLVEPIRAAETGKVAPVGRRAVLDGLRAQIDAKAEQADRMAEDWADHLASTSVDTSPDPRMAALRRIRRDIAALVEGRDTLAAL